MLSLGIDPSSSISGVALADADEIIFLAAYTADKGESIEWNAWQFFRHLETVLKHALPDVIVIEKVSVRFNMNTVRKIAYFEAVGLLLAGKYNSPAIQVQATRARKIALGDGGLSKEECHEQLKGMMPHLAWLPKNKGGLDQTDAAVLALAGPALMRERIGSGK